MSLNRIPACPETLFMVIRMGVISRRSCATARSLRQKVWYQTKSRGVELRRNRVCQNFRNKVSKRQNMSPSQKRDVWWIAATMQWINEFFGSCHALISSAAMSARAQSDPPFKCSEHASYISSRPCCAPSRGRDTSQNSQRGLKMALRWLLGGSSCLQDEADTPRRRL